MKQEWEPLWKAEPIRDLTKWKDMADSHEWIRAEQADDGLPTRDDYMAAVTATTGGAGLDGWASNEAKLILTLGEFLIDESYDLWIRTCGEHGSDDEAEANDPKGYLSTMLWGWRVAGIPKAGSAASRPISVASVWLRCWHRAMYRSFPAMPTAQWCGKRSVGVVDATADFLATLGDAGMEVDLSKAFDTLDYGLLDDAMTRANIPVAVRKELLRAWAGPRFLHVDGELSTPVRPTRGVPQGDPCCPAALALALAPWQAAHRRWLYMDDRSFVVDAGSRSDAAHLLDEAVQETEEYDHVVGVKENPGRGSAGAKVTGRPPVLSIWASRWSRTTLVHLSGPGMAGSLSATASPRSASCRDQPKSVSTW